MTDSNTRNKKGLLGPIYLLLIVLAICLLGAIALDYSHCVEVKAELQNATDAGALAGAAHLSFDIDNASPQAYKFTAANFADGRAVSNDSPGTQVTVEVQPPTAEEKGRVTVSATMQVSHFLARMFGRYSDQITVRSVAGTQGFLWRLAGNQAFPLAVSLNAIPSAKDFKGAALNTKQIGDDIYIGAQGAKNGTFTSLTHKSANARFIGDAIDQSIGFATPVDGFIPSVKVGEDIYLDNGMSGQMKLAKEPYVSAMRGKTLILPVIEGTSPFNQTTPVVAFIGFKVKNITLHQGPGVLERLTGTLVDVQVLGETGPYPATGAWPTGPISRISIGPIQLIE
jgi:hypothetical protein